MRQVIKHRDIRLLNMIRRTDPEIQSVELVTLLHSRVGSTSHEEYGDHTYYCQVQYLSHT